MGRGLGAYSEHLRWRGQLPSPQVNFSTHQSLLHCTVSSAIHFNGSNGTAYTRASNSPEQWYGWKAWLRHEVLEKHFSYILEFFNQPLHFLGNPNETLTNPLILRKAASVDTSRLIISTCCFPKVSDQSKSVSHYRGWHSLSPLGWMCFSLQFPKVKGVALDVKGKQPVSHLPRS